MIDRVIVKGKTKGVNIYSVRKSLTTAMKEAWESHELGINHYYDRDFRTAMTYFQIAQKLLPDDHCSKLFLDRCEKYIDSPPAPDWSGDTVLNRK